MKNLIVLLVLFSFVLVPFNTNAGNIDYSKTQIKVSGKNYTLTKVKDLLYKNITNKVNQKQTESLKIDSYNSFIKTLDKIIIQSKKSPKTQNIHLGYMIEDLKALLNNDLEKITNKTSQIEDKKEVLENTNIEGVKLDENFKITTSFDNDIKDGILSNENQKNYNKYFKIAENLYKNSTGNIKFDIDLSELINNSENKLIEGLNNEAIKNQRIITSETGKATLTKVNITFIVDGMGIKITEFYSNGHSFEFGFRGRGYSELSRLPGFKEIKATILKIDDNMIKVDEAVVNQEGVKLDENFKITTSFDKKIKDGIITQEHQNLYNKYYKIAENLYKNSTGNIKYDIDLSELINNSENKLVNSLDLEEIINQRKFSSENGKATLIKVNINFIVDGMGIEVVEYYSNGNNVGFGYAGMGLSDVKLRIEKFGEYTAGITQINGYRKGQSFGLDDPYNKVYYKTAK